MENQTKQVFETILVRMMVLRRRREPQPCLSLAEAMQSTVLVFAVIRPPVPAPRAELNPVLDDGREHYEQNFVGLLEQPKQKGVELETDIVVGHPAEQIVHRLTDKH